MKKDQIATSYSHSHFWKRLLLIREAADPLICWRVGMGEISFWFDN